MRLLRFIVRTRRHPSAILLLAQLLGMLLYPFLERTHYGHIAFNAFGILILAFTIRMVRRTPGETWFSVAMAVPVIALLSAQMLFDLPHLQAWSSAIEALFYFYAAGSLIAYMLADRHVTTDELYASAPRSPCWPGVSPICTWWCRHWRRTPSARPSTPSCRAPGPN